jgi:cytochrome b
MMRYSASLRAVHLGLASLCLVAWGTAQFADDYKNAVHVGFLIHEIVGAGFTIALAIRILGGLLGPDQGRFSTWFPFGKGNLRLVIDDLGNFARLRFPERAPHEGVAGVVQFLGLCAFLVIAATGTIMVFYLAPGIRATGWLHSVKEVHEVAQLLIPVYLGLHVGGALVHSVFGQDVLREMFFIRNSR